jgi:TolB-like protein/DNA-binding winged helix-turn-helix (wHTH) protein/Flp pilus assembly protein TadD
MVRGKLAGGASLRLDGGDTLWRNKLRPMATQSTARARIVRFGTLEADLSASELRKSDVRIKLHGQPFEVLAMLLERPGEVVTREELQQRLWPTDTFVDFDHGVNTAINRLREALGDSADAPRFVETLPRRGYRFIAQVEEVQPPRISAENSNKTGEVTARPARTKWRGGLVFTLCSFCAIGLAGLVAWRHFYVKGAVHPMRSIAVLPMENLSGDAAQEYFADGMTEELIAELARIQALKVISRTSVMEYKGTKKHLPQIARELGVDGIVEGSVIREGDQVRLTVQLLDGPNDRHLWGEDYQRELRGILTLQREMAQAIAQQIRVQLTPQQQARVRSAPAVNPEAYEAYLRGRFYLSTRFSTLQEQNTGKSYFEESIRKDPGFAEAYAGLARSYVLLGDFRHLSREHAYRPAKEALSKALELDNSMADAHLTLALLSWRYEWNWAAAEREYNYALALAPSYAWAHASYSYYLSLTGRRAEAFAEITRSRELDPTYSFALQESAAYYLLRDYERLIEAGRRGVASDPNEWMEHLFLGIGYEGTGKPLEAIPEYQKAIEMSEGDQDPPAALAHAYAVIGRKAEAQKILRDLERKSKSGYVSPYEIATIYAGLGNKDKAFEFLEKAYQERCLDIAWQIKADLRIDNLRSDPRFAELLRRIGLPQ